MILEKTIKVKDLPEALRTGADMESFVLVSVRSLTENGFTDEFEQGVLAAEKEVEQSPAISEKEFIKLLQSWT